MTAHLQTQIDALNEQVDRRTKVTLFWRIIGALAVVGMLIGGGIHTIAGERLAELKEQTQDDVDRVSDHSLGVADTLSKHQFRIAQALSEHDDKGAHNGAAQDVAVIKEQLKDIDDDISEIRDSQETLEDGQLKTIRALDALTIELQMRRREGSSLSPGSMSERMSRGGWPAPFGG